MYIELFSVFSYSFDICSDIPCSFLMLVICVFFPSSLSVLLEICQFCWSLLIFPKHQPIGSLIFFSLFSISLITACSMFILLRKNVIRTCWLMMLLSLLIYLLIFCLVVQFIVERGMFKSPPITVICLLFLWFLSVFASHILQLCRLMHIHLGLLYLGGLTLLSLFSVHGNFLHSEVYFVCY